MLFTRRNLRGGGTRAIAGGMLVLQGHVVGRVIVVNRDGPWCFGRFTPTAEFARFAAQFDAWSRLLHAGGDRPLAPAERAELAEIERMLDCMRAWLITPDRGTIRPISHLNIDGDLIEWKER